MWDPQKPSIPFSFIAPLRITHYIWANGPQCLNLDRYFWQINVCLNLSESGNIAILHHEISWSVDEFPNPESDADPFTSMKSLSNVFLYNLEFSSQPSKINHRVQMSTVDPFWCLQQCGTSTLSPLWNHVFIPEVKPTYCIQIPTKSNKIPSKMAPQWVRRGLPLGGWAPASLEGCFFFLTLW